MTSRTRVVWSEEFNQYDFGPTHPMNPVRLQLTAALASSLGLFDAPGVQVFGAEPADEEHLALLHDRQYIDAVRRASRHPSRADVSRGLGTPDDPAFAGMHESSARVFEASAQCAEQVWSGDVAHAVNFCGGMHHAMPDHASGFCIYNDAAAAIRRLLDLGATKVAYVDIDVHHGDGTQAMFWDDPRVMTISVHENGRVLFPGTGWPDDIGGPAAEGESVNVALPPRVDDAGWLRAIHAVVPTLLRAFQPQALVSQHGADTHFLDPLAHLSVTVDAQRLAAMLLHDLAHELCDGRWIATGGGGYEVIDVVPRAWAHLVAIAAHRPVDPDAPVPQPWRDAVLARFGRMPVAMMGDNASRQFSAWDDGYDPESAVDRAVMATRRAVFPLRGLDPWFD